MKHKRLAAAVLAAALWLTGCGGAAAPAAPAGSGAASQSAVDTVVQTAQKDRITEQFTLEKTVRDEYGITQKLTVHVPQLECDSPDAAYLNDELAAMYAADFRQYEDSPEIEPQQDEWCPETYINWDAYWYGDCVSLVMFRYDGGSDPGYSRGWCFDFATEKLVSVAEMLPRMGLDPDAVQQLLLRGPAQRRQSGKHADEHAGKQPAGGPVPAAAGTGPAGAPGRVQLHRRVGLAAAGCGDPAAGC